MNWILIGIIQGYFLIGAVLYKSKGRGWVKFLTYFLIVNGIFLSIANPPVFTFTTVGICSFGFYEILRIRKGSNHIKFIGALLFTIFSIGFTLFSYLETQTVFHVYFLVFLFDGFSQIFGQLFGKRRLAPNISPNKTWEGFLGGFISTAVSSILVSRFFFMQPIQAFVLGSIISLLALSGDLLASFYKRKCGVKDFGNMLPGHGGVLDRFDSFIFSGAIIGMYHIL